MNNIQTAKKWLGHEVKVKIDRPLGQGHPNYPESIYPVNYGFIPGTKSETDNEEINAYVLGPSKPLKEFKGEVIAVIVRKDGELKLVVTDGTKYNRPEIKEAVHFQEKFQQSQIVLSDKVGPCQDCSRCSRV